MAGITRKEILAELTDAETLYNNAPCGYISFTADGNIIKVNQTLLNWLNYQREELIDIKKFGDLLSKGGQIHYEMFFRPMLNVSGSVKELSYELVERDGSVFHVLFSASAIKDEQQKVLAINAILTDNTDRKKYEKEILLSKKLAEEEKRTFQFLADLIPEMIWTADATGEINYINKRFINYFDLSENQFNLRQILTKVNSEDRDRFNLKWTESVKHAVDLNIELRLQNRSGNYEWHLVKAVPYLNEQGELIKWFGSCTNIDLHKQALKQKDDFISVASHELKTPIASLLGTLQILNRMKNNPVKKIMPELIERAHKNVQKVNTLVGELLNVSQMNAGQVHLVKSRFNLRSMVSNSCEHVSTEGLFEIIIEGDSELEVCADRNRIEQVVINFINNAVKYAPSSKKIIVSFHSCQRFARVSVKDEGPGIPAEKIPHLFDRYYRVDTSGSQYSGLGLGLYICSEIITRHGGEIGVESQTGVGSTFWFTIPHDC